MTEPLPPELGELERQLAARGGPTPDAQLKSRVLSAMKKELHSRESWRLRRQYAWRFAAGVAAAMLLWLNLSLFATNHTEWNFNRSGSRGETLALSREIHELLPELSESESLRQAALLRANARALPILASTAKPAAWFNARKLLED